MGITFAYELGLKSFLYEMSNYNFDAFSRIEKVKGVDLQVKWVRVRLLRGLRRVGITRKVAFVS